MRDAKGRRHSPVHETERFIPVFCAVATHTPPPELRYNAKGTAYCSLTLETDKPGPDGRVFTSFHRVEITGRLAEDLSVTLEAGDEMLVEGEHQYRSSVDPKTQAKKTTCVLSTGWVSQRQPALAGVDHEHTSQGDVPDSTSQEAALHLGQSGAPEATPKRKPRYGKHLQRPWHAANAN